MSEIDFDELDKAVKQLMGGGTDPSASSDDEPKQKTLTITNTLQPGEKPTYDKLGKVAEGIGSETLVVEGERTVVEDLNGGLPADGRPPELPITVTSTPVTAAPPVIPANPVVAEPILPPAPAAPTPPRGRFMDMVSGPTKSVSTPRPVQPAVQSAAPAAPVVEQKPQESMQAPAEPARTPFLPDTKVEKRPLGGAESSVADDSITAVLADSTSKQFDVPEKAPESPEVPLATPPKQDAQAPADPTLVVSSAESLELQKIESAAVSPEPAQPAGIYDVNSYHQPINHPAKQKSGWSVVVIILIIVVVAAALGAAAYFSLGLAS